MVAFAAAALVGSAGAAEPESDIPKRIKAPVPAHVVGPAVRVRAAARPGAKVVRTFRDLRKDFRAQVIQVLGQRRGVDGEIWYRVALPGRPNGDSGFVPAGRLRLRPAPLARIVIDRSERQLELRRGTKTVMRLTVAVGKTGAETPLGRFHVTAAFRPTAPILGSYALETSAYSRITDWPAGGLVGIHGTPNPELLGQAVSSGCVRVHNRDILRLRKLAKPGTPIKVVA